MLYAGLHQELKSQYDITLWTSLKFESIFLCLMQVLEDHTQIYIFAIDSEEFVNFQWSPLTRLPRQQLLRKSALPILAIWKVCNQTSYGLSSQSLPSNLDNSYYHRTTF
ncbi:hypothetical protein GOP47_0005834 [Adiantum capillus-veneris]|uniref:Uncharacterized protein n=1 Tax=Adiantum capillus-veneris TaxID=13818 RepID=A0A9D4V5T6_ADICA|nr:hypothetical protein GOP47_0005834 [Adiantum capillus-veneris]